jgi:hypothetical protein
MVARICRRMPFTQVGDEHWDTLSSDGLSDRTRIVHWGYLLKAVNAFEGHGTSDP